MNTTMLLAQVMGIFLFVSGVSLLLNTKYYTESFREMLKGGMMTYSFGMMMIVMGALVVLNHNIWNEGTAALLTTLLGWIILLKGVFYMMFPKWMVSMANAMFQIPNILFIGSFMHLGLGIYLLYVSCL